MLRVNNRAVVDTNVILKMFFQENDSDKADLLLSRIDTHRLQVVIPSFLPLELANVLWLRVKQKQSTRAECERVLDRFFALAERMYIADYLPLLAGILARSIDYNDAAYDTAFLALAETLEVPFITADERLYRKVATRSGFVVLLRNVRFVVA